MSTSRSRDSETARTERAISWRMRADLVVSRQDSGAWVVKDPIALSYVQLSEQEMAILRLLDGHLSVREAMHALTNSWPASEFTTEDLADFVGQLIRSQLVVPTQAVIRTEKSDRVRGSLFWRWRVGISRLLWMRIRLLDPSSLLDRCQPILPVLFSRTMATIAAALCITAACLVILRFDQLVTNLPSAADFFGPENLLLVLIVFVMVKIFHEAGHAVAARYCGAECHEVGVMLLLLTPILYTNVTDAWMLNRRSRLLITAAGILVEVVLASIAAVLWFFAAPGFLKALLANIMVICTVGTILFNGNPLLRYDGYFLLTDATGRPNLAQRSSHRVRQFLEDLLLGSRSETLPGSDRFVLIYGLCSGAYRILIAVAILSMLKHVFDKFQLDIFGVLVMSWAAIPLVVVPLTAFSKNILAELAMRNHRGLRLLRAVSVLALLITMALIPLPQSIVAPAVVEPTGTPVFASLAGELISSANYGEQLSQGEVVAVLDDPSLQRQRIEFEGAVRVHEAKVRAVELRRHDITSAALPEARSVLESARTRLEEFDNELSRLTVTSPHSGILLPPRARSGTHREDALSEWVGHPLDERNHGPLIAQGTQLGVVSEPGACEVLLQLDAQDAVLLQRLQVAKFQPSCNPGLTWHGTVNRIAPLSDEDSLTELIVAGLTLPPSLRTSTAQTRQWQAVIQLDASPHDLPPLLYSTGIVRIQVEPASTAARLWRYLQAAFSSHPQ